MAIAPSFSSPPLMNLPSHHSSGNSNSFPVIAIAVIGILATALLLISYYIFVIKCCLNWHRIDLFNRFFSRVRDPIDEIEPSTANTTSPDGNSAVQKGLDEAIIRAIPVIKFRKSTSERKIHDLNIIQQQTPDSYECAVCLSEFEEGEKLRVIPNCCHAFHIDCIDVWLQSNANCPLCRSGISPASILYNTQQQIMGFPAPSQAQNHKTRNCDSFSGEDEDGDDENFVVIEIQGNNLNEPRLVSRGESRERIKGRKKLEHVCSMGDEFIDMRKNDEEFKVEPIRRSISMDLSSNRDFFIEIQESCRSNKDESNKVRRSIFSFGSGRSSSRCSVQPVHLDP
ncbi:RING-H2 finger protein ATL1-like [Amaranthus tricolor]|uniref:RING-H2 finger protein ATL1-like n=1 Tax=Amaranthus tricolor TaxID=29722 RepID=UPI002590670C|nr:RING-H2 finger protein ATL1-like [Amaranthus tricolor]